MARPRSHRGLLLRYRHSAIIKRLRIIHTGSGNARSAVLGPTARPVSLRFVETLPGHLKRLPEGGDRFQAELLSQNQRDRILAAMAKVVAKRGYQGTTVEHIVKRAGVARATFYENFENREDCLLAGFAAAEAEARSRILAAISLEEGWPDKVRVGLAAYLDYVVSDPALARTCIVESMTAGPAAMERYEQALQSFVPFFRYGRRVAPRSPTARDPRGFDRRRRRLDDPPAPSERRVRADPRPPPDHAGVRPRPLSG